MKSIFIKIILVGWCALLAATTTAQATKSREDYLREVKFYSEKIKQEPENISHYYLRGTFHHILTNFQASNHDFLKVLDIYSNNPVKQHASVATDACYFLADDYFFRKADRTSAQKYVERGLSISSKDKRFEVLQAGILGSYPERAKEAEKQFEALIGKYPGDYMLLLYYAKFLEKKDFAQSVKFYEKALAVNSHSIDAMLALGMYFNNEAARIYNTTGDALKSLQMFKKAAGYFEKIHKLNPNDREIIEILIQIYGNINMDDERKKMERKLQTRR